MKVALATCAEVPGLDADEAPLLGELRRRGIEALPAVWDDARVDWHGFDLVVLRSTWDYAERRDRFLAWVDSVPRVLNPPEVVRWNTDKRYLEDLERASVPVVPTTFVERGTRFEPPDRRFVVKPAVSAGSRRSASYAPAAGEQARRHVRALHEAGDVAMVQPYQERVDAEGETALVYIGGRFSHAVRKEVALPAGSPVTGGLYLAEALEPRQASAAELFVGERALAAAPADPGDLLYARVDLVPGDDGEPLVLELELTEPSLFLGCGNGAAQRLADAIASAVARR